MSNPNTMYKIRIPCNQLKFNNQKIKHTSCQYFLPLLQVTSYPYIESIQFVYKRRDDANKLNKLNKLNKQKQRSRAYVHKYIEITCNTLIKKQQLRRFCMKLQRLGFTKIISYEQPLRIDFIDITDNQIIHSLDYESDVLSYNDVDELNTKIRHKNRSSYHTHVMHSKL